MKKEHLKYLFYGLLAIAILIFFASLFSNNTQLKEKIKVFEGKNQMLEKENGSLKNENLRLKDSLKISKVSIEQLNEGEKELLKELQKVENELQTLKSKYAKNPRSTANFNADSIRLYFSNLK